MATLDCIEENIVFLVKLATNVLKEIILPLNMMLF